MQQSNIFFRVCLLLVVCLVKAQHGYDVDENSEYTESVDEYPDYSKYYSEDTSAPLVSAHSSSQGSESVNPAEFENFFGSYSPVVYSESNKKPVKVPSTKFVPEEKKQKDTLQTFESKKQEFPSYHSNSNQRTKKLFALALVTYHIKFPQIMRMMKMMKINQQLLKKLKECHLGQINRKKDSYDHGLSEEGRVEKDDDDYKVPDFNFNSGLFKNTKPPVDYNVGKSSSTVSQFEPAAERYNKAAASTPHEKYSFQPEKEGYASQNIRFFDNPKYSKIAQANYEAQSSEDVPSPLKGQGCRKVESESDDMNCFVCENAKTNGKYTQCSYSSQKEPVNYFEGNSAKYSLPHKEPSSYRYKRNAENEENDPYTFIRNRARKASQEPGIPSDYGSGFNYEPYHYDESKPEFTYSEQNSEELKKNPENCKKVEKKGMTCTICKDPKSGGNFEQCSYTSEPKEKKYAYVTEKKYENDEPVESQIVPQTKEAESTGESKKNAASTKNVEAVEDYEGHVTPDKSPKKRNEEEHEDFDVKATEKKIIDDAYNYEVPSHFIKSLSKPDSKDSNIESAETNSEKQKAADYSEFDEYHFKLFPEFAKQESRQEGVTENYQIPEATKQNVETVLAEFSKKDRSKCKKAEKKGMTCYLCVDQNNIQHEECMYVQESRPQSSHVAYHEVKAVKEPEKIKAAESRIEPVYAESKRKHFFKKVTTSSPLTLEASPSEEVDSVIRYNQEQINIKRKRSNNEEDEEEKAERRESKREPKSSATTFDDSERIDDKADPTIKTPAEFDVAEGEGAFSAETKPVYSKVLGVKLPKYMLEKSEFEKEFDDFAGSFLD
ncbi:hypothetical protein NQ314_004030 [Rhamnusium bicolor]|uniref:Uncharacterized protein n=1 Tax=Rhamnusium bicolor TaxID=1586634 RepID=A0AAV8ZL95_9CUCU|nr:hypothetical protein NQ314_004030 [Rhamnusium bicolor]